MAVLKAITNDSERVATLTSADTTFRISQSESKPSYISSETADMAISCVTEMRAKMAEVDQTKAIRVKENSERNTGLVRCNKYVRHFLQGIRNRIEREELPDSLLTHYGIPLSGILPKTYANTEVLEMGRKLIAADAEAVVQGHEPMANPSAPQLQAVIDMTQKEVDDTSVVDTDLNSVEEELKQLRVQADHLIDEIYAELSFNLRRFEEPDQRRIMRSYGIKFRAETVAE